jgi:hypothetical protein
MKLNKWKGIMQWRRPERSTRGVDEEADVRFGVHAVEEEELADDGVGEEVLDLVAEEDDALPKEKAHDITARCTSMPFRLRSDPLAFPQRQRRQGSRRGRNREAAAVQLEEGMGLRGHACARA